MYLVGEPEKAGNTSTSPEGGKMNVEGREGREKLANTYLNACPKGRNNRVPRSGTIAFFAISPLEWRVENRVKRARMGSIPFILVTKIDV